MDQKEDKPINYHQYVSQHSIKSDVDIILKDRVIKGHKKVLSRRNPVFSDILISQPDLNKFEILDLDANAVEIFINYLYTGRVSDDDISEELFLVAHKYWDLNLKNTCRKVFAKNLNIENAVNRLIFVLDQQEAKLLKETATFIARNFNDVKLCSDFNLVLKREEVVASVFDKFDLCKITVLSEDENPDQKKLVDSATKSDLAIKVKDHSFLGHKDVLSMRSRVFNNIISALPTSNNLASSISIPDFDPKTFKTFLQFIYTQKVNDEDISQQLMNVAHKYVESKLQKICEDKLVSTICEENAIKLLILSVDVGSQNLTEKSSKFIADRYAEMKEREDFQQVKENAAAIEAILNHFAVEVDSLKVQKNTSAYSGTFVLKVPVTLGSVFSEIFYMKNIAWEIEAELTSQNRTNLYLYLHCKDKNVPFKHEVNSTFKLISSVDETYDICSEGSKTYSSKTKFSSFGYKICVSYSDLNDKKKGLMENGTIKIKIDAHFIE